MPLFEFVCKKCGKKFEKIVFSINNEEIKCPECDSKEVEKQFSTFSSTSSGNGCSNKGSGDCISKQQHHCCNGCCHH